MEDQPLRNCYIDSRGKGYTFLSKANIGPVYKTDKKKTPKNTSGWAIRDVHVYTSLEQWRMMYVFSL